MAHSYTVEKFLKVPTEWHPPRKDSEGNWICPRDDLLPGCALQCNSWLKEYNFENSLRLTGFRWGHPYLHRTHSFVARYIRNLTDEGDIESHISVSRRSLSTLNTLTFKVTNHFIRATKRGNPVQLVRTGKRAWSITAPLPAEVSGPLAKFDATFGYPIDFACCCTTASSGSCTCANETLIEFWRSLSEFVGSFADGADKSTSIEPLRRRFVRFYVDLPLWSESLSPKEFRRGLIQDAETLYRGSLSEKGTELPWMDWPETHADLNEDDAAEMFSSDVSVLSMIRSAVERHFSTILSESSKVDHLLAAMGPILILQIGSVLDQLNLVELSEDVLDYFRRFEQSFVNIVPFGFIKRINHTLSKRNRMKGRFFNPQMNGRAIPANESILSKFREKLSRMLLHRRLDANGGALKENKSVISSDSGVDKSPVEKYWAARRMFPTSTGYARVPLLPFNDVSVSEGIQTQAMAEMERKKFVNSAVQHEEESCNTNANTMTWIDLAAKITETKQGVLVPKLVIEEDAKSERVEKETMTRKRVKSPPRKAHPRRPKVIINRKNDSTPIQVEALMIEEPVQSALLVMEKSSCLVLNKAVPEISFLKADDPPIPVIKPMQENLERLRPQTRTQVKTAAVLLPKKKMVEDYAATTTNTTVSEGVGSSVPHEMKDAAVSHEIKSAEVRNNPTQTVIAMVDESTDVVIEPSSFSFIEAELVTTETILEKELISEAVMTEKTKTASKGVGLNKKHKTVFVDSGYQASPEQLAEEQEVTSPPLPETQPLDEEVKPRRRLRIEKPKGPPLVVTHTYLHVPAEEDPPSSARWTVNSTASMAEWEASVKSELDRIINE